MKHDKRLQKNPRTNVTKNHKKLSYCCDSRSYCVQYFNAIHCEGDAENARHENAGLENAAQICRGWKMRDWKMWHKNAGRENAGLKNAAQSCRGWKMQEWKRREKNSMKRRI